MCGEATLENVLHVPAVKRNLFLVGACASKGFEVSFKGRMVEMKKNDEIMAIGIVQQNRIYRLAFKVKSRKSNEKVNISSSLKLWHEWFGYINGRTLREMALKRLVTVVELCDTSVYFLRHKSDVPEVFRRYAKLLENKFGRSIKTVR